MPTNVTPGRNDTSSQMDWWAALQRVLPFLQSTQPAQPGGYSTTGRSGTSSSGTTPVTQPPNIVTQRGAPDSAEARLRQYIDQLMGPLDLTDPRVQAILRNAQSSTALDAQNRGIQGGLALSGQQAAYIGASANLMDSQHRLAGSLLDSSANREIRRDEMDYGRFLDEQSRNQDLWRTGGSILGGLAGAGIGIAGGPATMPFLPSLIYGGSQVGAGVGGGIASMNQPSYPSSRSMYPTLNNLRI